MDGSTFGVTNNAADTKVVEENGDGVPHWRLAAIGISAAYLLFEVAFSARLLDAVGAPGRVDILAVEIWGRVLSGLALAIMVWSGWLLPRAARRGHGWPRTVSLMLVSGTAIVAAVYAAQDALIKGLVRGSTGEERRAAIWMTTVSAAVVDGRVNLSGIDLGSGVLATPEGKSLLAFLPFSAGRTRDLEAKAEPVVRAVLERRLDDAIGAPEDAWRMAWVPSRDAVIRGYNRYAEGQAEYQRALSSIPQRQVQAVRDYEQRVAEAGHHVGAIPPIGYRRVRTMVQRQGIPVSSDWNPNDLVAFREAVARKVREQAEATWRRRMADQGLSLPPNLSQSAFLAHAQIQERWRRELRVSGNIQLQIGWTYEQWKLAVWDTERGRQLDALVRQVIGNPESYADGGVFEEHGRKAIEALIVPPIALVFSLVGAASHAAKLTAALVGLLVMAVPRIPSAAPAIAAAIMSGSLVAYPTTSTNAVVQSEFYKAMEREARDGWGEAPAIAMRWVILAQPMLYPIGDGIRRHMLLGVTFGVPDTVLGNGDVESMRAM